MPEAVAKGATYAGGSVVKIMFFSPFSKSVVAAAVIHGTIPAMLESTLVASIFPAWASKNEPNRSLIPARSTMSAISAQLLSSACQKRHVVGSSMFWGSVG